MRIAHLLFLAAVPSSLLAQPLSVLDLLTEPTSEGFMRIHGSAGLGSYGVPVAGGQDFDGDGHSDFAIGAMTANVTSPEVRVGAGQAFVIFGDGSISGTVDTAVAGPPQGSNVLRILGGVAGEHAGSELWADDVTGDGKADLLVCRQDHDFESRNGAGALTIVVGSSGLKEAASDGVPLDLANPDPQYFTTTTIGGADAEDRVCIWARTGDVDGDGIKDIALGADRRVAYPLLVPACPDNGVVYVVRGGAHLASGGSHDLDDYGSGGFGLAGNLAEIHPPDDTTDPCNWHFGATVAVGDLDGNGRSEVLGAAALNRSGAALSPPGGDGSGGPTHGRVIILWDNWFPETPWSHPYVFAADDMPAWRTEIAGASLGNGVVNDKLGEEMLAGFDFNGEAGADLFLGDITGNAGAGASGFRAGLGVVLYDVAALKGQSFNLSSLPEGLEMTLVLGPSNTAISSDTAAAPDIQGDGIADLAIGTPNGTPGSRARSGVAHVLVGRTGGWPLWPGEVIDLAALPPSSEVEIHQIDGAESDDMIFYSAASADVDGDGREDLLFNEMLGDTPSGDDIGNLIVLTGARLVGLLFEDDFEDGTVDAWSSSSP